MVQGEEDVSLGSRLAEKKTIISFAVAIIILYLLFSQVDFADLLYRISTVDPVLYLLAFIVYYASFPLRGLRWSYLLNNIGIQKPLSQVTEIFFLSWFANCIVPAKLGDIYRGYLMKVNYGVSGARVLSTIFVERIYDVMVLVVLLVLTSLITFGTHIPGTIFTALAIGVLFVIVLLAGFFTIAFYPKKIHRIIPGRLKGMVERFSDGLSLSIRFHNLPQIFGLTLGAWFLESGRLYLVIAALGTLDIGMLSPAIIIFVALAAALLTALPITPAGLGAVEFAIVGVLLIVGVDESLAFSIAILDRLISYWSLLLFGGVNYAFTNKRGTKKVDSQRGG